MNRCVEGIILIRVDGDMPHKAMCAGRGEQACRGTVGVYVRVQDAAAAARDARMLCNRSPSSAVPLRHSFPRPPTPYSGS